MCVCMWVWVYAIIHLFMYHKFCVCVGPKINEAETESGTEARLRVVFSLLFSLTSPFRWSFHVILSRILFLSQYKSDPRPESRESL